LCRLATGAAAAGAAAECPGSRPGTVSCLGPSGWNRVGDAAVGRAPLLLLGLHTQQMEARHAPLLLLLLLLLLLMLLA